MSTTRLFANSLNLDDGLLAGYQIGFSAQTAKQTAELRAEIIRCLSALLSGKKIEALKTKLGKHKITVCDGPMCILENGNIEAFVKKMAIAIEDESPAAEKAVTGYYHNWRNKHYRVSLWGNQVTSDVPCEDEISYASSVATTISENEVTTSESDDTSSEDENMLKNITPHSTPTKLACMVKDEVPATPRRILGLAN